MQPKAEEVAETWWGASKKRTSAAKAVLVLKRLRHG